MFRKSLCVVTLTFLTVSLARSGEGAFDKLPGVPGIACDARLLETGGRFKIAKVGSIVPKGDAKRLLVYWVLEAQMDMTDFDDARAAWGLRPSDNHFRGPRILFKDQDKVMIEDVFLSLQGFHPGVKKGDGVRVFIEIPRDVLQDTRFTTIVH